MTAGKRAFDELLRHPAIWKTAAKRIESEVAPIPTGFPVLDDVLPDGGWRAGALTEILTDHEGIGELGLLMPGLARISCEGRWVVWIAPPHIPYSPALMSHGISLAHVLVVRTRSATDALWAAEQALRCAACGAALFWWPVKGSDQSGAVYARAGANESRNLRRLQLAAEAGRSSGILFRHKTFANHSSPATLRLLLEPTPQGSLRVNVLKCRGRAPEKPITIRIGLG